MMKKYLIKRIFWMVPTFLGITLITFFVLRLSPNYEWQMQLMAAGPGLSIETLQSEINQNKPRVLNASLNEKLIQTLAFFSSKDNIIQDWPYKTLHFILLESQDYLIWLKQWFKGDWGYSSRDYELVKDKIFEVLPLTLIINSLSLILIYLVSVPLGMWAALKEGRVSERLMMSGLFLLYAMPLFWVAGLLLVYLAGGDYLNLMPLGGLTSNGFEELSLGRKVIDVIWHLTLPVLVLSFSGVAFLTRFTKENLIKILSQDFIRTAKAKGLKFRHVLWRHAFRNALLPFVTLLATLLPSLLGGSVIVEEMFAIPGMGRLSFEAVMHQDTQIVMALTTLSAGLTLISLFLQDILYVWLDPRVDFESR